MQSLVEADKYLFRLINSTWSNDVFDLVLPFTRNALFWYPFYFFLILFVLSNFGTKAFWWIIFAAGTAILTDFVSSDLIKPNIFRLRPCNDPAMAEQLRFLLGYRPGSSSFTSSHAANHFGFASFFYFTLVKYIGKWALLFFCWATLVCYSQVYVGVHYPLDVISGGLIGFVLGYLPARMFNKNYGLL